MVKAGMMISERYEIIEKVGSGGMADVFRAKCHRLNRFVAIKFLKQEYSQDTKFVTKFKGEAQSVAGLSHPNIVGIFDVGEDQGLYYIVMEYIEGITLKRMIEEKGKLTVKESVGIGLQIAAGLSAAHSHNIVHRDIKPQNILISRDGTAKVTDFGIAKAASSNTITSNAMGSVHYISPEQARGGFSDEKSDIYSLGVTMYEMLSGTLPFTGESTVAVALAHVQEEATPLCAMDATIPKGLSNIVQKCMQKKQEMRYLAASALIGDLKMFLSDPTGNYGVVAPMMANDSPTIFISDDDIGQVRGATRYNIPPKQETNFDEKPEEESDVDPKLEKALVFGSIAVAIIIGIIIIVMLGRFLGLWGGSGTTQNPAATPVVTAATTPSAAAGKTIVPDVESKIEADAIIELENNNLKYEIKSEASDVVEKGYVIGTNPVAGEEVDQNSNVILYVSSGKKKVAVPSVIGYTLEDAQTALEDAGFKVETGETVYSDTVEVEMIAETSPAAGKKAEPGSTVTISQSKGVENKFVKVPNLKGLTKSKAKAALVGVGLKLGSVSTNYSDSYSKNQVCAQSVSSGNKIEKGTAIDITLSLGQEVTYQYVAKAVIDQNPFEYETDAAAKIKIVLSQDGKTKTLQNTTMTYSDFPRTIYPVVGFSTSDGEVIVYKDGVRVTSYNVTFTKVEQ